MKAGKTRDSFVLGAGITGLAAGLKSGLPVLEAAPVPGGLCASYYLRPNSRERLYRPPAGGEAYRFELGGGHWIFGGEPATLEFLQSQAPLNQYTRRSSVYFHGPRRYVPYPLQNNLRFLDADDVRRALDEMSAPKGTFVTMRDWLLQYFGPTLCERFFFPFHELYTSGLYRTIAPQDAFKSPVDMNQVRQGATQTTGDGPAAGYNATFRYPANGLDDLIRHMADASSVQYGRRVERIDPKGRELLLADGSRLPYNRLISTLPLNEMLRLTGLSVSEPTFPHTAVLVLNIGARKGARMPDDHWLYNPDATSGFHRVGFYSNVDVSFLPASARDNADRVSIYVERSYPPDRTPSAAETDDYIAKTIRELQEWDFIGPVDVVDSCWIPVAYTWALPGSNWIGQSVQALEAQGIRQTGRYGCWKFQGIADSIRDGFQAAGSVR